MKESLLEMHSRKVRLRVAKVLGCIPVSIRFPSPFYIYFVLLIYELLFALYMLIVHYKLPQSVSIIDLWGSFDIRLA